MEQDMLFGVTEEKSTALKIGNKSRKVLSKKQQAFNRLSKRIENLEVEIARENEKVTKLIFAYAREVKPLLTEIANNEIRLAMTLGSAAKKVMLKKSQEEKVRSVILTILDTAFHEIEPTAEAKEFYNQWVDSGHLEGQKQIKEEAKEFISDFINDVFGMDVDMRDIDDTPEGYVKFRSRMQESFERSRLANGSKPKKKTKKQMEREEFIKAEEEMKKKSIRNIYIALSKLIHPDTETEPVLKAQKEEIMKKVTTAYQQKDLAALLKLEIEWVHKENEYLEKLTDDSLKMYISVLKEQIKELEAQKEGIYMHSRAYEITDFSRYPEHIAYSYIAKKADDLKKENAATLSEIAKLENPHPKKQIVEFVNEVLKEQEDMDYHSFLNMMTESSASGSYKR